MSEHRCTCGHDTQAHLWPPRGPRAHAQGWSRGGCRAEGCACKVYERDHTYIPASKALNARERSERLTGAGAQWLTRAARVGGWDEVKAIDGSSSLHTRLRHAIQCAAPYAEGATLERLKGGDLGPKAWRTLITWLREREYVFGADTPCPMCGRKG